MTLSSTERASEALRTPGGGDPSRGRYLDYNAERNSLARRRAAFASELRHIRAAVPGFPERLVLDIGCGPGVFTEFLEGEGAAVCGIDFDVALIAAAQRRLREHGRQARFLVGRVEHLPFRDGSFDCCIADSILEHVPDWQTTLREATRVLRRGGTLVFYTANRWHPFTREINHFPFYPWVPDRLKRVILSHVMERRPGLVNYTEFPAVNWFTYEQLRAFLEPMGYEVKTRLDLIDPARLTGWKRAVASRLLPVRRMRLVRILYYLYAPDVSVYAVKSRRTA